MTLEEALAASEAEPVNDIFTVNPESRTITVPDTDTIPEWEQPGSTNPYAKGDKVMHNGKTWQSTTDNNVWEPGVYGWEEV